MANLLHFSLNKTAADSAAADEATGEILSFSGLDGGVRTPGGVVMLHGGIVTVVMVTSLAFLLLRFLRFLLVFQYSSELA